MLSNWLLFQGFIFSILSLYPFLSFCDGIQNFDDPRFIDVNLFGFQGRSTEHSNANLVQTIESELHILYSKIEVLENRVEALEKQENNYANSNSIKNGTNNIEDKQLYDKAFSLLRTSKFSEAEALLLELINLFPRSNYVASAYYWLGEIYWSRKDYQSALDSFDNSYNSDPTDSKSNITLLKIAKSSKNLGDLQTSCNVLNNVLKKSNLPHLLREEAEVLKRSDCSGVLNGK